MKAFCFPLFAVSGIAYTQGTIPHCVHKCAIVDVSENSSFYGLCSERAKQILR